MDHVVNLTTDTATVALFDVEVLRHRIDDSSDWWCFDFSKLEEVRDGRIALVSTGADGPYQVRLTSGELTQNEMDYASVRATSLGIECISGMIFVGAGEELPSGGFFPSTSSPAPLLGEFVRIPPGKYDVEAFGIDWFISPHWWNDEYHTPPDAPVDVVVVVKPRQSPFAAPETEPRLVNDRGTFLFPSDSRVVGPIPGMVLTTEVWKREGNLTLKTCGPLSYKPIAEDLSGLKWRNRVNVKVLSVDHGTRSMQVEVVDA